MKSKNTKAVFYVVVAHEKFYEYVPYYLHSDGKFYWNVINKKLKTYKTLASAKRNAEKMVGKYDTFDKIAVYEVTEGQTLSEAVKPNKVKFVVSSNPKKKGRERRKEVENAKYIYIISAKARYHIGGYECYLNKDDKFLPMTTLNIKEYKRAGDAKRYAKKLSTQYEIMCESIDVIRVKEGWTYNTGDCIASYDTETGLEKL